MFFGAGGPRPPAPVAPRAVVDGAAAELTLDALEMALWDHGPPSAGSQSRPGEVLIEDVPRGAPVRGDSRGPANDPLVVLDGADLERTVDALVDAKFVHSGQTCTAPERVLVQAGIHDPFLEAFVDRMRSARVGDPTDPSSEVAPPVDLAVRNIEAQLADAVARGGRILCGARVEAAWWPPPWWRGPTGRCSGCDGRSATAIRAGVGAPGRAAGPEAGPEAAQPGDLGSGLTGRPSQHRGDPRRRPSPGQRWVSVPRPPAARGSPGAPGTGRASSRSPAWLPGSGSEPLPDTCPPAPP